MGFNGVLDEEITWMILTTFLSENSTWRCLVGLSVMVQGGEMFHQQEHVSVWLLSPMMRFVAAILPVRYVQNDHTGLLTHSCGTLCHLRNPPRHDSWHTQTNCVCLSPRLVFLAREDCRERPTQYSGTGQGGPDSNKAKRSLIY